VPDTENSAHVRPRQFSWRVACIALCMALFAPLVGAPSAEAQDEPTLPTAAQIDHIEQFRDTMAAHHRAVQKSYVDLIHRPGASPTRQQQQELFARYNEFRAEHEAFARLLSDVQRVQSEAQWLRHYEERVEAHAAKAIRIEDRLLRIEQRLANEDGLQGPRGANNRRSLERRAARLELDLALERGRWQINLDALEATRQDLNEAIAEFQNVRQDPRVATLLAMGTPALENPFDGIVLDEPEDPAPAPDAPAPAPEAPPEPDPAPDAPAPGDDAPPSMVDCDALHDVFSDDVDSYPAYLECIEAALAAP